MKATQCTYSKGEIQGTINVRQPCDKLLEFLVSSGEIPNITDEYEDRMDTEEMEIDSMDSDRTIIARDYLERNFGGHTEFKWQMPHYTTEVFCVFPNR